MSPIASSFAVASPIPELAPATMNTLSRSEFIMNVLVDRVNQSSFKCLLHSPHYCSATNQFKDGVSKARIEVFSSLKTATVGSFLIRGAFTPLQPNT